MRLLLALLQFFLFFLIVAIVGVSITSVISDPYIRFTNVQTPYFTLVNKSKQIEVSTWAEPNFSSSFFQKAKGYVHAGIRIPLYALFHREKPLVGDEQQIITQIHEMRFNPDKPYVITGAHYSDLYMRNLGVFYNAILDPNIPSTDTDWENRQRIAVQTVSLDLAFLKNNLGEAVTTLVPNGGASFTGINIYGKPSDSLFAVIYTLHAMKGFQPTTQLSGLASFQPPHLLQTVPAANQLLKDYQDTLTQSLNFYAQNTLDSSTGLVRSDVHLAGARDGAVRSSSFYDNVVAWSTFVMADDLKIPHQQVLSRSEWKQKILDAYWDDVNGIFRDSLPGASGSGNGGSGGNSGQAAFSANVSFSADSFIVLSTGFLDPTNAQDTQKLQQMIAYVKDAGLDQPFPLHYSKKNSSPQLVWFVRLFAPSYMSDSIWSHWGMEYIKTILALAPQNCGMLVDAESYLDAYRRNIDKYGGYPEVYKANGEMYTSLFMRSVLYNGWIIDYEQARAQAAQLRQGVCRG